MGDSARAGLEGGWFSKAVAVAVLLATGLGKYAAAPAPLSSTFPAGLASGGPSSNTPAGRSNGSAELASDDLSRSEWVNRLGMRFRPVAGTGLLFSVWETRVRDFEVFEKETGYDATPKMYSLRTELWVQAGNSWRSPGFPQSPDHPVCGVSWQDAEAFCRWLSQREGKECRLPTDLEWSRAIGLPEEEGSTPEERREQFKNLYPWGTQWPPPAGAGNYADGIAKDRFNDMQVISSYRDGFAGTAPVGSFPANQFGLYDLSGNLWEWCADWYNREQKGRVLRGGSWYSNRPGILSSERFTLPSDLRSSRCGFRVVVVMNAPGR